MAPSPDSTARMGPRSESGGQWACAEPPIVDEAQVESWVQNGPIDWLRGARLRTTSEGATGTGGAGTVLYTHCPWVGSHGKDLGSCEPPACPSGWEDRVWCAIEWPIPPGRCVFGDHGFLFFTTTHGTQERGCYHTEAWTLLQTRCSLGGFPWQGVEYVRPTPVSDAMDRSGSHGIPGAWCGNHRGIFRDYGFLVYRGAWDPGAHLRPLGWVHPGASWPALPKSSDQSTLGALFLQGRPSTRNPAGLLSEGAGCRVPEPIFFFSGENRVSGAFGSGWVVFGENILHSDRSTEARGFPPFENRSREVCPNGLALGRYMIDPPAL